MEALLTALIEGMAGAFPSSGDSWWSAFAYLGISALLVGLFVYFFILR